MGITAQVRPGTAVFAGSGTTREQFLADVERHTQPFREDRSRYWARKARAAERLADQLDDDLREREQFWRPAVEAAMDPLRALLDQAHPGWRDDDAAMEAAKQDPEVARKFAAYEALVQQVSEEKRAIILARQTAHGSTVWYQQRAQGQLNRFEKVASCGETHVAVSRCKACGVETDKALTCSHHRLCLGCRGRRLQRSRGRIRRSLTYWIEKARGSGWTPKFLTLTLPHSGDVRADVVALTAAWRRFWREVEAHLRKDRKISKRVVWFRVLEITPSGGGHAHLHAMIIAPFIHQALLAHLWGRSLPVAYRNQLPTESVAEAQARLKADWQRHQLAGYLVTRRGPHGRPLDRIWAPVVDVREWAANGKPSDVAGQIAAEAAKYLVKDAERSKDGSLIWNAITSARCYEAAEGHRAIATSRGFWIDSPVAKVCKDCGSLNCIHTEVVRSEVRREQLGAQQPGGP